MKDMVIIIPAYNPDEILIHIVEELKKYYMIIVVDDGSENEYKPIFNQISKDVILKTHDINQGKGNAIKTGMMECINQNLEIKGIITVDADGQHKVEDVIKLQCEFEKHDCIVLGVRDFNKMPGKNRIGNKISKFLIEAKYKIKITDTQTGLRLIPKKYLEMIVKIPGNGFDYETEMLKVILKNRIPFKEVKIETIYDKNKKSKFKILLDSFRIAKTIIKR